MKHNKWLRLLTYVSGLVNQELLLQNEYFAAENRILRAHMPARLRLSNPERSTLAEIGKRLGRKALAQVHASLGFALEAGHAVGVGGESLRQNLERGSRGRGCCRLSDTILPCRRRRAWR